jgi:hypothetical protein
MKTPAKRKPKSQRQLIILANDNLFREIIRARDKVCQKTGMIHNLQVCHYFSRSNLRTRWEELNGVLINGGSHIFWCHKYPDKFREWYINRLGQEKFEALELMARYSAPVKTEFLLFMNYKLKERLKALTPNA